MVRDRHGPMTMRRTVVKRQDWRCYVVTLAGTSHQSYNAVRHFRLQYLHNGTDLRFRCLYARYKPMRASAVAVSPKTRSNVVSRFMTVVVDGIEPIERR